MTGRQLWQIFSHAQVPGTDLALLGEDIGHKRERPGIPAARALLQIARTAESAGQPTGAMALFGALKDNMPGIFSRRHLLETLAHDYKLRSPWETVEPEVRHFLVRVAASIPQTPIASVSRPALATSVGAEPIEKAAFGDKEKAFVVQALEAVRSKRPLSDGDLATARNYAARADATATVKELEAEMERRRQSWDRRDGSIPSIGEGSGSKLSFIPWAVAGGAALSYLLFFRKKGR